MAHILLVFLLSIHLSVLFSAVAMQRTGDKNETIENNTIQKIVKRQDDYEYEDDNDSTTEALNIVKRGTDLRSRNVSLTKHTWKFYDEVLPGDDLIFRRRRFARDNQPINNNERNYLLTRFRRSTNDTGKKISNLKYLDHDINANEAANQDDGSGKKVFICDS